MSMTRSRDRAYATREAASTRRTRSTGRGGPRFLLYSGVNQPSHGGTGTPTADPAGGSTGLGRSGPPTHVYQPSLALTRFAVPNPGSVQGYYIPSTTQLGSTCPKHITLHRTGGGPLLPREPRVQRRLRRAGSRTDRRRPRIGTHVLSRLLYSRIALATTCVPLCLTLRWLPKVSRKTRFT